jgi:glyoxalase superfamily protein
MATKIQVVFDCTDPDRLAHFWASALHYELPPPPEDFDTWEGWLKAQGIPEDEWNWASAVQDPEGDGSRIYFQRVPERKIVKNRVHIDLNVGGGGHVPLEDRQRRVDAEVERLINEGATVFRPGSVERGEYWVVMQDPEGNEFCVQ